MRVDRAELRKKRAKPTKKPSIARRKPIALRQARFTSEPWYERAAQLISIPLDRRERRDHR